MKKNTPAKKGFAPFKETSRKGKGDDSRPAKRGAGGRNEFRPRKSEDKDGFRPRKNDDKESTRPRKTDDRESGFRPRKTDDKEGFRPRKNNDSEGFRPRKSDDKEGFRPRKTEDREGGFRPRKFEDKEGTRPGRRPVGKDENGDPRPAFKKKEQSEGDESSKRTRIKPQLKTANGRTPFKPKPGGERSSRPERGDRSERPERSSRSERSERGERSERPERGDRSERPERSSRSERPERSSRSERPERSSRSDRDERSSRSERPERSSRSDRDDSAFHGSDRGDRKDSRRDERETPSGFNRKKYFDNTNERFAAKQDRKTSKKQDRDDDTESVPGEMPLNKYIAHCGLCSRRKAVDYVKEGKITVNGEVITEPAFKVTPDDNVALGGKKIYIQKDLVYILLNKPKGYITTTDDPEGRKTVMELIHDATENEERVYPVGRLDRNTSGLLLLTNDGELAQRLSHPKHKVRKIYHVGLNKPLTKADFEAIMQGVTLEDGVANVDALGYVESNDKTQLGIEIHSGKNRIVRRIFEHLGYDVEKLDRVTYAGLTKKNINRGKWRFLTEKEIILLKHFK
jgi:23S rRNA pseudouridine2605 synthase